MIVNLSFLTHVRNHRLCFIAEGAIFASEEGDKGSELKKPYRWPHSSNVLINQNPKGRGERIQSCCQAPRLYLARDFHLFCNEGKL